MDEKYVEKLKQTNVAKKQAVQTLHDVLIRENDCDVLKETLQKQIINLQNLAKLSDENVKILFGLHEEQQTVQFQVPSSFIFT